MKIAILGGSFDPPHIGHVLIAEQVREILDVDEIWLMPLFQKNMQNKVFHKQLTPVEHRLAMTRLLENTFIKASNFEILHNKTSYTYNTLQELKKHYPENTFYWILGSDQLADFQKYYQWKKLIALENLIVFPREHILWHLEERVRESFNLQKIPENVIVLQNRNLMLTNISSTAVRDRIKKGLSIDFIIPEVIKTYIKKNKLYT